MRITLIGPSPYDDVTRTTWFAGGYNGVMQQFAQLDKEMAHRYGGTFVDLNAPVVEVLKNAEAKIMRRPSDCCPIACTQTRLHTG